MVVAGDHAKNDLNGNEPDSWRCQLESLGYQVECSLEGLGEMASVRKYYVNHARKALRGTLYGIGVGPGDPELLTVKAVRVLKEANVIAVPDRDGEGTAYEIVKPYVAGKEILPCATPMVRDRAKLDAAYDAIAEKLQVLLEEGKSVAFVTLGDVAVYSTYMYIHDRVVKNGYDAAIVPGVPSFCAAAARLGISLCEGKERLMIVPAARGDVSDCFQVDANLVFMKSGKEMPALRQALREQDMIKNASMVENCTMKNEHAYLHMEEAPEESGYFSLVIVKREGDKA
jgi:precorrin-2/cobalt-factor-2 C20-methyltransferase